MKTAKIFLMTTLILLGITISHLHPFLLVTNTRVAAGSSYLFYDSFEDGTFNKWTGTEPFYGPSIVEWSVTNITAYEGTRSAQMALYSPPPPDKYAWGGYYVDIPFEASGSREAYWRSWVKFNELPVNNHDHTFMWILAKGPPPWATRTPTGDHLGVGIAVKNGVTQLHIRRYHPKQVYYDVPYPFERNKWYLIEISVRRAVDGWYKAWVNEKLVFNEQLDTSMAPELGAASLITSALSYQSYPAFTWFDECIASNNYIGVGGPLPPSPPSWSNLGHNSTYVGTPCKFSALWRDSDGLSGYIFSWNGTGTWTNSTFVRWSGSPTSAWSNVTMVLPITKGVVVGYRFYANETYKGWNVTRVGSLVTEKPQGWEETRLTMSLAPITGTDWYTVSGSLTFTVNGTGISGARLRVYVGYDTEFNLITTVITNLGGQYSFRWQPSATGEVILRIVYVSDRSWILGTRTEGLVAT